MMEMNGTRACCYMTGGIAEENYIVDAKFVERYLIAIVVQVVDQVDVARGYTP